MSTQNYNVNLTSCAPCWVQCSIQLDQH